MSRKYDSNIYEIREFTSLRDMLVQSAELFSDKNAFLIKNKDKKYVGISYRQFKKDVFSFGTSLLSTLNLCDKRIAIMAENRYEWAVSYLAVVNLGVAVPVDKEVPQEDVENILKVSEASAIIFSGKYRDTVNQIKDKLSNDLVMIDMDAPEDENGIMSFTRRIEEGSRLLDSGNTAFEDKEIDVNIMSVLLFTSGTTGMSKGVMLSQNNICSNIKSIRKTVYVGENDSVLSILPLHHTYECTIGFLTVIYCGVCISYCEGLKYINKNIDEIKPTTLVTVPLLLENVYGKIIKSAKKQKLGMAKIRLGLFISGLCGLFGFDVRRKIFKEIHDKLGGRLRLIITGAAAIDPKVSKRLNQFGLKVLQGYGLTECSPLALGNNDKYHKDSSCGMNIPDVEVKIHNPDENGNGEIIIKGPNVMLGYYNDPDTTEAVLRDGWFYSGDLGKIDKDGFFTITGRLKNVIVTKNGKNIYPEEMEYFLNNSPYIQESLVWGEEDEQNETFVSAQIYPDVDAIKEKLHVEKVSDDEVKGVISQIIKEINAKLPLYKHIRGFDIRNTEFVKTTTKKIKRYLEVGKKNEKKK